MNEEDLEKLVFGMAHQIRNPCAIILANANVVLKQPNLKPDIRRSLDSIVNGVKYLESRLDEFVEFSKPLTLKTKNVSVNEILNYTSALFKEKCQMKNTKISCVLDDKIFLPDTDREKVLLAVLNIVLNAVESIDQGGEILLKAGETGGKVWISVRDTGNGIHPRDLPEVFSPFYSTKQGGIGIGLAISKKIVAAHNGKIEVSSELNKGTTVTISLPGTGNPEHG